MGRKRYRSSANSREKPRLAGIRKIRKTTPRLFKALNLGPIEVVGRMYPKLVTAIRRFVEYFIIHNDGLLLDILTTPVVY